MWSTTVSAWGRPMEEENRRLVDASDSTWRRRPCWVCSWSGGWRDATGSMSGSITRRDAASPPTVRIPVRLLSTATALTPAPASGGPRMARLAIEAVAVEDDEPADAFNWFGATEALVAITAGPAARVGIDESHRSPAAEGVASP